MRNTIISLFALLFLVSCNDFTGSYQSPEDLTLVHTTIFGNKKAKLIPAGQYSASLGFSSENKVKISLKTGHDSSIDVKIQVPEGTRFPSNGRIDIPARRTGQNYDIKGNVNTDISYSGRTDTYERCEIERYETQCRRRCDSRRNCRRICERVRVTYPGSRDVTYHYVYTDRDIQISFYKQDSRSKLGRFNGAYNTTDKVYDYRGICR
jgi:hypothetical protein